MRYITVCDVEIPIVDGPVGISCSGGADSSLLLFLLMSNVTAPLHIFTLANNVNFRSSAVVSATVIEKCIQLTGNINITHHTSYTTEQTIDQLFTYPDKFHAENKVNWLYTGITASPPKHVSDTFAGPENNTEQQFRDPSIQQNIFNFHHIRPFYNIDKRKIREMYDQLGLLETLFPFTRSCEHVSGTEYYDHCGKCWWCKEREWGFGRLK